MSIVILYSLHLYIRLFTLIVTEFSELSTQVIKVYQLHIYFLGSRNH